MDNEDTTPDAILDYLERNTRIASKVIRIYGPGLNSPAHAEEFDRRNQAALDAINWEDITLTIEGYLPEGYNVSIED